MQKAFLLPLMVIMALCLGCAHNKRLYTSNCSEGIVFKKVSYAHLVDSIGFYNRQYVEVSGRYMLGKNLSALLNDSLFADHGNSRTLWVNFTQDCPLYLSGTQKGFFDAEDGSYTHMNNRMVTIKGRVDVKMKGHQGEYRGTVDEVSFVEIY